LVKAAERSGTLNVTLRSVQDTTIVPSEGVTAREIGGGQSLPESTGPEKTPVLIIPPSSGTRSKPEVTIIRATTETTINP
jgi:hypothetical protein